MASVSPATTVWVGFGSVRRITCPTEILLGSLMPFHVIRSARATLCLATICPRMSPETTVCVLPWLAG